MYIFSRSTIAALGRQFDAMPAAIGVAELVTKGTGHEVNVFAGRFGAPQGSVMWSARVESMAELQGITDKLMADQGYLEMLESMNGLFMAPSEDRLSRVLTAPNLGWTDVALRDLVHDATGLPVLVTNDSDAATQAELSSSPTSEDMLEITHAYHCW